MRENLKNVGTLSCGSTNTASPSEPFMVWCFKTWKQGKHETHITISSRRISLKVYTGYIDAKLLMITIFHNCCWCKPIKVICFVNIGAWTTK
jgi:hypothetical protein